jgi:hypothetical protein
VLLLLVGVRPVYSQLVEFPLRVFPRVRDLPLERPFEFLFTTAPRDWQWTWFLLESSRLLPFLAAVVALVGCGRALLQRREATAPLLGAVSVLALASINQYRVRSGESHAWPLVVTALILVPPLIAAARQSHSRLWRRIGALGLIAGSMILVPDMIYRGAMLITARYLQPTVAVDSPAAAGIRIPATDRTTNALLAYLRTHAVGEPYIFSGTVDHDQVMFNDALIYFLAERRSPTPYPDLVPGIIDTAPVQREVVDALNRHAVETVVMFDFVSTEPNESSQNKHVDILDRFLAQEFRQVAVFPPFYTVLRRSRP